MGVDPIMDQDVLLSGPPSDCFGEGAKPSLSTMSRRQAPRLIRRDLLPAGRGTTLRKHEPGPMAFAAGVLIPLEKRGPSLGSNPLVWWSNRKRGDL